MAQRHLGRVDRLRELETVGAVTFHSSAVTDGVREYDVSTPGGTRRKIRASDLDAWLDGYEAGLVAYRNGG